MDARHEEAAREEDESAFTPILRALLRASPHVVAVVFVDPDGECVDYCSSLDAYEAKVVGAQMLVVATNTAERLRRLGEAPLEQLIICGEQRDLCLSRVGDGYSLVTATTAGGATVALMRSIARAVHAVKREGGFADGDEASRDLARELAALGVTWSPHAQDPEIEIEVEIDVETQASAAWPFAPGAFSLRQSGARRRVEDVIGRFVEYEEHERICFRVRTDVGDEITLSYETDTGRWTFRTRVLA